MLQTIQKQLAEIYALPFAEEVNIQQFLLDHKTFQKLIEQACGHLPEIPVDEQIFVEQSEENTLAIGLYLREGIFKNLDQFHPETELNEHNFADFCSLVEGVSHFLFLYHRNRHTLSVKELELEVQAEVDKFITAFIYKFQQGNHTYDAQDLLNSLFIHYEIKSGLSQEQHNRYRMASDYAEKLCHFINRKFLALRKGPDWTALFSFLRQFYRSSWQAKFATISSSR